MIQIHNSASRKKEDFVPLKDGEVSMYVCGPTVYDVPHLGHGRSAVSFDVIRRYFIYKGFKVNFVSNYTDIDDKMINRANDEGITVKQLTEKIVPAYEEDYGKLGILPPDVQPYATEHIEEMIDIIRILDEKGHTYVLDDGVYFDVSTYAAYGEFSGQELENLQAGARVDVKDSKRTPFDFVLWKFKKEGEPFWASPWGDGRPGWHIECSAMSFKHLGESFDIHGGGLDLTFPHHECEVAQSCCAFGSDTFAKYWIHNGFIKVDDEKMSKSLNNFFTLRDVYKKYDPQVVRMMILQTHYRNPINFSDAILDQAKAALSTVHDFIRKLSTVPASILDCDEDPQLSMHRDELKNWLVSFEEFMDDDFNTSGALSVLFGIIKLGNEAISRDIFSKSYLNEFVDALKSIDSVLGVIFSSFEEDNLPEEIAAIITEREEARAAKDWGRSDELRDQLLAKGYALEDSANGTIWKKV